VAGGNIGKENRKFGRLSRTTVAICTPATARAASRPPHPARRIVSLDVARAERAVRLAEREFVRDGLSEAGWQRLKAAVEHLHRVLV
jgi:hypothetical protein